MFLNRWECMYISVEDAKWYLCEYLLEEQIKSGTVKIFVLLEILVKKNMAFEILLRLTFFFFFNKPLHIFWSKENCKKKI